MSKRTEQLFKLNKQLEKLEAEIASLKEEIISEEIVGKGKDCLQDRFVTVSYCKGKSGSISIDQKVLSVADNSLYLELVQKYPKVTAEGAAYYRWAFAKDK